MVAGGIGQTPFLALGREYLGRRRYGEPPRDVTPSTKVTLCYGARTADLLAGVEDFQRIGIDVRLCTEDGSCGHHGIVTDLLEHVLAESESRQRIVCCGPEPMMEAVAGIAAASGTPCEVSLETPMACGIGICFTCVAKIKDASGDWDYQRTCVEGPVFDATRIEW
jgi:dihydroorotate dehydrogenase electron transfer subunit